MKDMSTVAQSHLYMQQTSLHYLESAFINESNWLNMTNLSWLSVGFYERVSINRELRVNHNIKSKNAAL